MSTPTIRLANENLDIIEIRGCGDHDRDGNELLEMHFRGALTQLEALAVAQAITVAYGRPGDASRAASTLTKMRERAERMTEDEE